MKVSLFTREWIEILKNSPKSLGLDVSLFTREWIEILDDEIAGTAVMKSPSLRGSGLKFQV